MRAEIILASNSATAAICCSRNLQVTRTATVRALAVQRADECRLMGGSGMAHAMQAVRSRLRTFEYVAHSCGRALTARRSP